MADPSFQHRLIDVMRRSDAEQKAFLASLVEGDRMTAGSWEHWSVKDHIAHIAAWQVRQSERMSAALRGETPPSYDDFNALNAATYEQDHYLSWPDVLARADQAFEELVSLTARVSDADLTDPQRFPWLHGAPLWRSVVGNTYWHVLAHLTQCHVERGDLARAERLQERMVQGMLELDSSAETRSVTLYNLACVYAQSGQAERAIALLREALPLNPGLVEWSKEDPDLVPLRDRADYRALYEKPTSST